MSNAIYDQYRIQEELNQLIAGFQRNNVAISYGYSPMTVGCASLSFDMLLNAKLVQENMELAKQQRIIHQILNSSTSHTPAMQYYPPSVRGNSKRVKNSFSPKLPSYVEPVAHQYVDKGIMAAQISKATLSQPNHFTSNINIRAMEKKEAAPVRLPLFLRKPLPGFMFVAEESARPKTRQRTPPPPTKAELALVMQIIECSDKEVEDLIKNFPPVRS